MVNGKQLCHFHFFVHSQLESAVSGKDSRTSMARTPLGP